MIRIKETNSQDFKEIMRVKERAFGNEKEAKLTTDLLHDETKPTLSLLGFDDEKAEGCILFTRVYMNEMNTTQTLIHRLAPFAVIPEYQNQGIGGMLIREGIKS